MQCLGLLIQCAYAFFTAARILAGQPHLDCGCSHVIALHIDGLVVGCVSLGCDDHLTMIVFHYIFSVIFYEIMERSFKSLETLY